MNNADNAENADRGVVENRYKIIDLKNYNLRYALACEICEICETNEATTLTTKPQIT